MTQKIQQEQIQYIDKALIESKDYFLENFAKLVCGDNEAAVYKSSSSITKFFNYLDYPYVHDGSTRYRWVKDILSKMKAQDLLRIYYGLIDNNLHTKIGLEKPNINNVKKEFKEIISVSMQESNIPNFSHNKNINLKSEKLQNNKDDYLDELLEGSEKLYQKEQAAEAIYKLYGAFERIKTHYTNNKKASVEKLVKEICTYTGISEEDINNKFKKFTEFGNNYNIRHHEKRVTILKKDSYAYIYNDLLNFMNLIINTVKNK
jgi:hypothetical protein